MEKEVKRVQAAIEMEKKRYTMALENAIDLATRAQAHFSSHVGNNLHSQAEELVAIAARIETLQGVLAMLEGK